MYINLLSNSLNHLIPAFYNFQQFYQDPCNWKIPWIECQERSPPTINSLLALLSSNTLCCWSFLLSPAAIWSSLVFLLWCWPRSTTRSRPKIQVSTGLVFLWFSFCFGVSQVSWPTQLDSNKIPIGGSTWDKMHL